LHITDISHHQRFDVVAGHSDRTDGNCRFAGDLLRPSREIEIGPKLGLPKATLRAMEHIDASLDKRQQEVFEMVRSGKKIRLIISMHRLTGVRPIPVGYCVDA
jgi:hypothetical protein